MTPAISVEGSGYWFDRSADADAFAAALKVQAGLPVARPVVPFLTAGVGLYRASFDPASNTVPGFYRNRLNPIGAPAGLLRTFTDPSFIAGAGVNVFLSGHIAIRPDVEVTLIGRNTQTTWWPWLQRTSPITSKTIQSRLVGRSNNASRRRSGRYAFASGLPDSSTRST